MTQHHRNGQSHGGGDQYNMGGRSPTACEKKGRALDKVAAGNEKRPGRAINKVAGDERRPARPPVNKGAGHVDNSTVDDKGPPVHHVDKGKQRVGHVVDEGAVEAKEPISYDDVIPRAQPDKPEAMHEDAMMYNAQEDLYTMSYIGKEVGRDYCIQGDLYRILRPHQKEGLVWLWKMHCQRPGGIIADEMGLGKTLQTAIFLAGLIHSKLIKRAMIIVKVSILKQWSDELKTAGLQSSVHIFYGSDSSIETILKKDGILLTTYETYFRCHRALAGSDNKWDYTVLDEAHKIKNPQSKITKSVNKIQSNKKIVITGTPLQKDLMDIFSLVSFIHPGLLGNEDTFIEKYVRPVKLGKFANASEIQKRDYLEALEKLRRITSPYILRRSKDILIQNGDLCSKKHDVVLWLKLTELQVILYKKLYKSNSTKTIQHHRDKTSFPHCQISTDICNNPSRLLQIRDDAGADTLTKRKVIKLIDALNIDDEAYRSNDNSCKIAFILNLMKELFLEEKIEELQEKTHNNDKNQELKERKVLKILIFSQHLYMLDALQEALASMVEGEIIRIDGSVSMKKRGVLIEKFKLNEGPRIFLLSAQAGGEGLNLTAATKLIIVDPSWNSSDDNQIADRIYRLGQKQDVTIYRLFTCGTIEEHYYKTQLCKGALGKAIVEGKFCASAVKKQEGKVLRLPDTGFDSSEIQKLLENTIGNSFELDAKHLKFLKSHHLVAGLTDQNLVFSKSFSKDEISFDDLSDDESDGETSVPKQISTVKDGNRILQTAENAWCRTAETTGSSQLPSKKPYMEPEQLGDIVTIHTIKIPENTVGALIGKGGATVQDIEHKSSTRIHLIKREDPTSSYRTVHILGTLKEFEKANQMIKKAISMADQNMETYFSVPEDKIGWIIGPKGIKIKAMEAESGADIRHTNTGRFRIRGTKQQVEAAELLMSAVINKPSRSSFSKYREGNTSSSQLTSSRSGSYADEQSYQASSNGNNLGPYGDGQGYHTPEATQQRTSAQVQPSNQGSRSSYYGERGSGRQDSYFPLGPTPHWVQNYHYQGSGTGMPPPPWDHYHGERAQVSKYSHWPPASNGSAPECRLRPAGYAALPPPAMVNFGHGLQQRHCQVNPYQVSGMQAWPGYGMRPGYDWVPRRIGSQRQGELPQKQSPVNQAGKGPQ